MEAAAVQNQPPLGRVLVDCGLLTEEQLAQALDAQRTTGRKLGEILVSSGIVSGPAIANALAEQRGTVIKTEYGFGTGLASRRRPVEAAPPPVDAPQGVAPTAPAAAPAEAAPDRLSELEADLESRDTRIAELQAELGRRAARSETLHARIAELEKVLADTGRQAAASHDPAPVEAGTYVVVLPGSGGYRVLARQGSVPPLGSRIAVGGSVFVAESVGPSPLPGDGRPCIFLV